MTTNPAHDALRDLRADGDDTAISTLADYLDDPAAISSPWAISACDTLIEMGGDDDLTTLAETLSALDLDFARAFALANDLCPFHFCDIMICRDDETPHP